MTKQDDLDRHDNRLQMRSSQYGGGSYFFDQQDRNFLAGLRFGGEWTDARTPYLANQMVTRGPWLSICLADTSDEPAPVPTGPPAYLAQAATLTPTQVSTTLLATGNRYTLGPAERMMADRARAYIPSIAAGVRYWGQLTVYNAAGQVRASYRERLFPTAVGWIEVNTGVHFLGPGEGAEALLIVSDSSSSANWNAPWNFTAATNASIVPVAGQFHENRTAGLLQVHKTDATPVDQSANLATVVPGSVITSSGGRRWMVQDVTDNTTWVEFGVAKLSGQESAGLRTFTFDNPVAANTTYDSQAGFWTGSGLPGVPAGVFIVGSFGSRVENANAYGAEVRLTPVDVSGDWKPVAYLAT